MNKILFVLQASFNSPEYGSSIGESISVLLKAFVVVIVIAVIIKLFKPNKK